MKQIYIYDHYLYFFLFVIVFTDKKYNCGNNKVIHHCYNAAMVYIYIILKWQYCISITRTVIMHSAIISQWTDILICSIYVVSLKSIVVGVRPIMTHTLFSIDKTAFSQNVF